MKAAIELGDARRILSPAGLIALAAGCVSMVGCSTQLQATRVVDPLNLPREGAPYNLTFTQYELVITRRLVSCFEKNDDGKSGVPQVTVATEVAATRKEARDPKRDYVIDFSQLRSFFKTTDVSIEYHDNGALKAVNAKVEDQTGPFLTSLITTVGKAITVSGGGLIASSEQVFAQECKQATLTSVAQVKDLKAAVERSTDDIAALTEEIERLTKMAQVMGRAWSVMERSQMKSRISDLYGSRARLKRDSEALAKALKALTVTTKMTWPEDGETRETAVQLAEPLTPKQIEAWAQPTGAIGAKPLEGNTGVWANLVGTTSIGRTPPCTGTSCADDRPVGLKYRMPVPGVLLVCSTLVSCKAVGGGDIHEVKEAAISQLGPVMTLPLKNYPFMNQSISATFNEAGQPTKLGFVQTPSLDKAAGVLGSLADEVSRLRKEKQPKEPKSELDTINDEVALLKAKAALAAAQAALVPPVPPKFAAQADAVALLTADTTLLKAELAKIEAEVALAKALAQTEKP